MVHEVTLQTVPAHYLRAPPSTYSVQFAGDTVRILNNAAASLQQKPWHDPC